MMVNRFIKGLWLLFAARTFLFLLLLLLKKQRAVPSTHQIGGGVLVIFGLFKFLGGSSCYPLFFAPILRTALDEQNNRTTQEDTQRRVRRRGPYPTHYT